ncbi:unnamed protein product [Caenorhabditis nigoni]
MIFSFPFPPTYIFPVLPTILKFSPTIFPPFNRILTILVPGGNLTFFPWHMPKLLFSVLAPTIPLTPIQLMASLLPNPPPFVTLAC